ncbi:MAG TPA: hypothetical protein DCP02_07255 [Actinobacteria bacterium]|nr:hypothetical protein [Actinomycetota bacterium]
MELVGFSVCHQLDSRSLAFGDIMTPVCSRCGGIYIGFMAAAAILFIMFRKKQNDLPPLYVLIISAVFFLSTIIDGLASYSGLYMTNNIIRFSTGFLCGASIMTVLYPVFNFQYYKKSLNERIFKKPATFIIFTAILIASIVFTLFRFDFLGNFYYYLSGISVIFTFFFVSLVMIFLIPPFSQQAEKLFNRYLMLPAALALILTFVEIFIAYKLHQLMARIAL